MVWRLVPLQGVQLEVNILLTVSEYLGQGGAMRFYLAGDECAVIHIMKMAS